MSFSERAPPSRAILGLARRLHWKMEHLGSGGNHYGIDRVVTQDGLIIGGCGLCARCLGDLGQSIGPRFGDV